jgi:hypothetical protein
VLIKISLKINGEITFHVERVFLLLFYSF